MIALRREYLEGAGSKDWKLLPEVYTSMSKAKYLQAIDRGKTSSGGILMWTPPIAIGWAYRMSHGALSVIINRPYKCMC